MLDINYFVNYKNRKTVIVATTEYLLACDKLSKELNLEENMSSKKIDSIDSRSKSCWLIQSVKTNDKVKYKGSEWNLYFCVFSIMGKNGKPFAQQFTLPSFIFNRLALVDHESQKFVGVFKDL